MVNFLKCIFRLSNVTMKSKVTSELLNISLLIIQTRTLCCEFLHLKQFWTTAHNSIELNQRSYKGFALLLGERTLNYIIWSHRIFSDEM